MHASAPASEYEPLAQELLPRKFEYCAIRRRFVEQLPHSTERKHSFNFSNYLYLRMAGTVSELVEIPSTSWVVLLVLLAGLIVAYKYFTWKQRLLLLVAVGCVRACPRPRRAAVSGVCEPAVARNRRRKSDGSYTYA